MNKGLKVLLLLAFAPVIAFAGGQDEAAFEITDDSELVIWADDTRTPILESLGAQFTEQYGVPVTVQELGFGDIRDNIKVAGPAGEGADIIIGAHDWLGELVTSGIVSPIDLGRKASDFTDSSIAGFTYEGELYGMPYAVENIAFVYNPNFVSDVPETWEEVRELSVELQDAGVVEYGFVRQEGDPYHFFPIQTAYGGYVFGVNADGTYDPDDVGIDNAGSIEAARWLEQMVVDGNIPAGVDGDTYHTLFESEQAAMIITGPWAIDRLNASGVDYEIANLPGGGQPFLGVQGFMISAFSENQAMAQAFLTEFVATSDVMFELFERGGRPPAYVPALERVEDARLAAFGAAGVDGLPMPAIPEMSAVWGAWGDAVTLIMQEQVTGSEAFETAAEQIRSTIAGN